MSDIAKEQDQQLLNVTGDPMRLTPHYVVHIPYKKDKVNKKAVFNSLATASVIGKTYQEVITDHLNNEVVISFDFCENYEKGTTVNITQDQSYGTFFQKEIKGSCYLEPLFLDQMHDHFFVPELNFNTNKQINFGFPRYKAKDTFSSQDSYDKMLSYNFQDGYNIPKAYQLPISIPWDLEQGTHNYVFQYDDKRSADKTLFLTVIRRSIELDIAKKFLVNDKMSYPKPKDQCIVIIQNICRQQPSDTFSVVKMSVLSTIFEANQNIKLKSGLAFKMFKVDNNLTSSPNGLSVYDQISKTNDQPFQPMGEDSKRNGTSEVDQSTQFTKSVQTSKPLPHKLKTSKFNIEDYITFNAPGPSEQFFTNFIADSKLATVFQKEIEHYSSIVNIKQCHNVYRQNFLVMGLFQILNDVSSSDNVNIRRCFGFKIQTDPQQEVKRVIARFDQTKNNQPAHHKLTQSNSINLLKLLEPVGIYSKSGINNPVSFPMKHPQLFFTPPAPKTVQQVKQNRIDKRQVVTSLNKAIFDYNKPIEHHLSIKGIQMLGSQFDNHVNHFLSTLPQNVTIAGTNFNMKYGKSPMLQYLMRGAIFEIGFESILGLVFPEGTQRLPDDPEYIAKITVDYYYVSDYDAVTNYINSGNFQDEKRDIARMMRKKTKRQDYFTSLSYDQAEYERKRLVSDKIFADVIGIDKDPQTVIASDKLLVEETQRLFTTSNQSPDGNNKLDDICFVSCYGITFPCNFGRLLQFLSGDYNQDTVKQFAVILKLMAYHISGDSSYLSMFGNDDNDKVFKTFRMEKLSFSDRKKCQYLFRNYLQWFFAGSDAEATTKESPQTYYQKKIWKMIKQDGKQQPKNTDQKTIKDFFSDYDTKSPAEQKVIIDQLGLVCNTIKTNKPDSRMSWYLFDVKILDCNETLDDTLDLDESTKKKQTEYWKIFDQLAQSIVNINLKRLDENPSVKIGGKEEKQLNSNLDSSQAEQFYELIDWYGQEEKEEKKMSYDGGNVDNNDDDDDGKLYFTNEQYDIPQPLCFSSNNQSNFKSNVNFGPRVNFGPQVDFGPRVNFGPRVGADTNSSSNSKRILKGGDFGDKDCTGIEGQKLFNRGQLFRVHPSDEKDTKESTEKKEINKDVLPEYHPHRAEDFGTYRKIQTALSPTIYLLRYLNDVKNPLFAIAVDDTLHGTMVEELEKSNCSIAEDTTGNKYYCLNLQGMLWAIILRLKRDNPNWNLSKLDIADWSNYHNFTSYQDINNFIKSPAGKQIAKFQTVVENKSFIDFRGKLCDLMSFDTSQVINHPGQLSTKPRICGLTGSMSEALLNYTIQDASLKSQSTYAKAMFWDEQCRKISITDTQSQIQKKLLFSFVFMMGALLLIFFAETLIRGYLYRKKQEKEIRKKYGDEEDEEDEEEEEEGEEEEEDE